jgi:hypothetical protein
MNEWKSMKHGGMMMTGRYISAQRKTSPSATFLTKYSTQTGLGSKVGRHSDRQATNHMS